MKKFLLSLIFLGAACIGSQAQTRTFPYVNGSITPGDCLQFDPTATLLDPIISDAGVTCGGGGGGGGTPGGPNHSVEYNNGGSFGGVVLGAENLLVGTATNPISQTKPAIEARGLSGIDCTGAADSSTALNALTGNAPTSNDALDGRMLSFAGCSNIKLTTTWLIKNQAGFSIDSLTRSGTSGKGTLITWAGGAGGVMIDMEYVDGFEVKGLSLAGGANAGVGIQVDKNGAGGTWNTTDGLFKYMTFNGGNINWIGLSLSPVSGANVEDMRVMDSTFNCTAAVSTTNAVGFMIGNSANAKNEVSYHNNISTCLYGIWLKNGSLHVNEGEFSANGGSCGTGNGADIRIDSWTDPVVIENTLSESGTQGISQNSDTPGTSGGHAVLVRGNHAAPAGCENPSHFWYNVGGGGEPWVFEGDTWDGDSSLVKVIGTANTQLAPAYTRGMVYPNSIFAPWWTNTTAAIVNDEIGLSGDKALVYGAKTSIVPSPGNNLESPELLFRGYLGGSTSAPDDVVLQNIPSSQDGLHGGTFLIKHQQGVSSGTEFLSWDGAYPGILLSTIPNTVAPGVSHSGVAGGTTYSYSIVAYGPIGNTVGSPTGSTATGNSTLSISNFNFVQWYPISGAVKYCVWRVASGGTPSSLGNIGCVSALVLRNSTFNVAWNLAPNASGAGNLFIFNDTGLAGDGASLPGLNTTGDLYQATGTTHCWNQDTGISRDSADTIDFGNCIPGDTSATLQAGQLKIFGSGPSNITLPPSLFAALASCGGTTAGSIDPVSDSTTTTPGATITGGGANDVMAYCNGSNWIVASGSGGVNIITFSAPLSGGVITGSGTVGITGNGIGAAQLAAQYSKLRCEPGLGDGLNAIPAGTYLQFSCVNTSGVTWTVTGISCWTDNAGTSTLNAANNAAAGLLTGAVTCNNTKSGGGAVGTQSGTTTLANNDAISFTFVSDGTSKQTTWTVSLTQ